MHEVSFIAMLDNGGRRLKVDRRKKRIPISIPERRSGKDRRSGIDRRHMIAEELQIAEERRKRFLRLPSSE
jgi:hypothetical protein